MLRSEVLEDLMRRELDRLQSLRALLGDEADALARRDGPALERFSGLKQSLLAELEGCAKERKELIDKLGGAHDRSGFESLLAHFGDQKRGILAAQWERIQAELHACRDLNIQNGIVLDAVYRSTQQALAVLLGQTRDASTYDAQGTVRNSLAGRTSIKA